MKMSLGQIINKLYRILTIKPKRYYGHIISLGYNCEVSFQFFKKYHFTESSLFAWCSCQNIQMMIKAINDVDNVGNGELTPSTAIAMWQCQNSGIYFHGKGKQRMWRDNPPPEFFESDLVELRSRLAHLRQKFIDTCQDSKMSLYIYKCPPKEAETSSENLVALINELYQAIKNKGDNPFDLLIIFEQNTQTDIEQKINNPHIFVRRVKFFSNPGHVISKPYDKRGWGRIFSEFKPNFKLPKRKRHKFEDE